jgi:alanine-synthesizing transaminase
MSGPVNQVREILSATRLEHVRYAIRDIAVIAERLAAEGKTILPLNIGDPLQFDFRTPPHLFEAVVKAMADGKNGYAPSLGVEEAREAVRSAAHLRGFRNIQDVFITQGVSEAVDVCLSALVNPGENVLLPSPEYPLYSAVLARLGAQPNSYALDEGSNWEPDVEHLAGRIFTGTRAIVLINPNNPTGAIYSRRTLERIAELARQHNLVIIADEIYDKLMLDGDEHVSIATLAPDVPVVTFNGLSKAYLVPGWRVGWGIVTGDASAVRPYIEGIHKLLRSRISANHAAQYAVRPALERPQDHLAGILRRMRARRDMTYEWANSAPGMSCVKPRGAFYAFPKLDITESDEEFVRQLLMEKHVLAVHGSGFGQAPGTRHMRIVFLPDEHTLGRAFESITAFLLERRRAQET